MKFLSAVAAASVLAMANPSGAEPAPAVPAQAAPASPAAAAPSAKAIELTKRYFEVVQFRKLMDTMMDSLVPVMADEQMKSHPDLPPEARKLIIEVTRDAFRGWFEEYLERMTVVYAQTLTEEELQAAVDFYGSPIGQSITRKSQLLSPKAVEVMKDMLPGLKDRARAEMCKKIDCAKLKTPPLRTRS